MRGITWLWQASHDEAARHLSDHLEDELRGLRRLRVLAHLARCEPCAAAYRSLIRTVDALRALGSAELEPQPALADAVVARIHAQEGAR